MVAEIELVGGFLLGAMFGFGIGVSLITRKVEKLRTFWLERLIGYRERLEELEKKLEGDKK